MRPQAQPTASHSTNTVLYKPWYRSHGTHPTPHCGTQQRMCKIRVVHGANTTTEQWHYHLATALATCTRWHGHANAHGATRIVHRHTRTYSSRHAVGLAVVSEFMIESSHFERMSPRMTSPTRIASSGARHTLPVWRARTTPRLCRNAEPPRVGGCSRLPMTTVLQHHQTRCSVAAQAQIGWYIWPMAWYQPVRRLRGRSHHWGAALSRSMWLGSTLWLRRCRKRSSKSRRNVEFCYEGFQVLANRPSHGPTLLRTRAATQAGLSG